MANSRVKNSLFNVVTSVGGQFLTIILQFVARTVFIYTLGKEYLGISSLFSNVLSILSLAELGLGSAMLFKLYDPLAHQDTKRIAVLMKFYKRAYTVIAIVIAVLGLCLIPFLKYIISDYDTLETLNINGVLLFLLYLFNTVSSYLFFAYKSALIKADQKEYILNITNLIFIVLQNVLQITALFLFNNFIVYVAIMICCSILQNCVHAIIVNKRYPYIKQKVDEKLSKEETKGIIKDCGALALYKVNSVVLKSTDNIVISIFLGLQAVALYSNYYLFYTTISTLYTKINDAVVHSIGNLHTTHDNNKEYDMFNVTLYLSMMLGGIVFVGIFVVADEFIETWVGQDWIIAQPFSFLMGLELFTASIRSCLAHYRNAMGLFQQAKFRPLFSMIINIVVSVVLVNYLGIIGVIIGTLVAEWTTFMVFDPGIIIRNGFKVQGKVKFFYLKIFSCIIISCLVGVLCRVICTYVLVGYSWFSVILHAIICVAIFGSVMFLLTFKTKEFKYLVNLVVSKFKKIKDKK